MVSGSSLEILQEAPFIVRDLAHAAELVAGFAGVDGAVVLARDLQIVGFGAEITAQGEFNETILEFQTGETRSRISLENVGMRHRSAAYLARSVPGVLIFVVSQDGGVSAFTMGESQIERHLVASTARMD